jgi:hypothetical protein
MNPMVKPYDAGITGGENSHHAAWTWQKCYHDGDANIDALQGIYLMQQLNQINLLIDFDSYL